MEGKRWGQPDGERERKDGQQQWRRRRIKKQSEVMAVMNSSWLISRSQLGVWRLDFNTGLWLQSACRKKTTRKKANLQLFHTTIMIVPVCPWWGDPAKRPCWACSGLCPGGRWVHNSQAFKIQKKQFWILDSWLQSSVVSRWFIEHSSGVANVLNFFFFFHDAIGHVWIVPNDVWRGEWRWLPEMYF